MEYLLEYWFSPLLFIFVPTVVWTVEGVATFRCTLLFDVTKNNARYNFCFFIYDSQNFVSIIQSHLKDIVKISCSS